MFFAASKLLWIAFEPINILVIVGLVGLALGRTSKAALGQSMAAGALLALLGISVLPIADFAMSALEHRFPPWRDDGRGVDGIIVLGGAVNPDLYEQYAGSGLSEAVGRITEGAALARRYPAARVIYAGGNSELAGAGPAEATVAAQLLTSLGLNSQRLALDTKSRNTFENAVFAKEIAKPKPGERWLLVTSAFHMSRSVGCFRQAGFQVDAYPVDYRSPEPFSWTNLGQGFASRRSMMILALHEITGLVAYRLSGKTTAFWPAP